MTFEKTRYEKKMNMKAKKRGETIGRGASTVNLPRFPAPLSSFSSLKYK
jgi:hypothetical protein